MTRLFKAWSVVDNFNGREQVKFNWFVVGRQEPVDAYEKLVENYDAKEDEAWCDQILVNELFTEAEVEELGRYLLQAHQIEIQVQEVSLPVRSGGLSYGLLLINGAKGFYTLADEEGYDLSVSVLGYYDLEEQNSSNLLAAEDLQKGHNFLYRVFNDLNITLEHNDLSFLLNKIYKETGLCVQQKNTSP